MKRRTLLATLLAMTFITSGLACAQTVISRPIRLIVPYVPGGGTDTLSRMIAPFISEEFGQPIVVDNRPGASSTIGTQIVARATPDGQTIGMIDPAFLSNPSLYAKLPYDTLKDFTPVVLVAKAPLVLCVHPSSPAATIKELVALAKANPGKLTFGSAGNGGGAHLAGEQLRRAAGIDLIHVPYKGAGQQLTDLLGAQTNVGFFIPSVARAHITSGRLRALGTTSATRSKSFPGVPTFQESGYPAVDAISLNGIIAPARTPTDYVTRLNATIVRALNRPEMQQRLLELGFEQASGTPQEFKAMIAREIPKLGKLIKDAGIQVESLQ